MKWEESMIKQRKTYLDRSCHRNYHKRIVVDLSRQANLTIPQQANFTGKVDEDYYH